jgi:hypothetical protein
MNGRREIMGLWWTPGDPGNKWVGTLTLDYDKSPKLDLTVAQGFGFKVPQLGDFFHGCDGHGKPITLLYPGEHRTSHSAALTLLNYSAGFAILGIELPSRDEFLVNSLAIQMQHFYEWAGVSGFFNEGQDAMDTVKICHRVPQLKSFPLDADLTVEIGASFTFHNGLREKRLAEDSIVQFKSRKGLSFGRCEDLINAIRGLLHFGVLSPVYPVRIECRKDGYGLKVGEDFIPHEIEIWSGLMRDHVESEPPDSWVFRFPDVEQRFGQFIRDWLSFTEKYDESLRCYFTTVYFPLPSSVEHICLAQALEAFHASKFSFKSGRRRKFFPRQKGSFIARMRHLVRLYGLHFQSLIHSSKVFSEAVRDTRNFYTHHDAKLAAKALAWADLSRLNERMKLLYQMCVLTEMGIAPERFSRLRRQLAQKIVDFK